MCDAVETWMLWYMLRYGYSMCELEGVANLDCFVGIGMNTRFFRRGRLESSSSLKH